MQCQNCGTAGDPGAAFCAKCGAALPAEGAPTQPMPASAAPLYPQPVAAQYPQPVAQQPVPGPPQPPLKKKTGLIIAIVAVVLLFLLGGCIAAVLVFMPFSEKIEEIPVTPAVVTTETAPVAGGFGTAEEALASVLETGWVFKATRTTEDRVTYWTGPPNSEYVDEIVVEKGADGSWTVTDQYTIGGDDVDGAF